MKFHPVSITLAALVITLCAWRTPCRAEEPTKCVVTLTSPTSYAVFQRSAANTAKVLIAGRTDKPVTVVEASVVLMPPYQPEIDGRGVAYTVIAKPRDLNFAGALDVPAGGWYELKLRARNAAGDVVGESAVQKVGVGEVLIAAGHSFCSAHNAKAPTKAVDDRVATLADGAGAAGRPLSFRHCDDPLRPADGNHGSPWPACGDALVGRLHVPVLLISTGIGGSTVAEWLKGAEHVPAGGRCYPPLQMLLRRVVPVTGLRGIVWFGNENDLWRGPTAETFRDELSKLIAHTRADSSIPHLPWVIAFDAHFPDVAKRLGPPEKQRRKGELDRGTDMVLESVPNTYDGPQTDDLGARFRMPDGDHFNEAGLQQLGSRFARKICQAFFPAATPAPQVSAETGSGATGKEGREHNSEIPIR
ncbi:MAG: sialate O-acetylesterase [Planctomycetes bacterium]|nr:sialate O-acetylesterase [Planctomycetota bacterium]